VGTGKAEEIAGELEALDADVLVFDMEITPTQQRNWSKLCRKVCVIDRQEVILDIFADRANTREAVLQVELARWRYQLPRLAGAWSHLSRQRGGAVNARLDDPAGDRVMQAWQYASPYHQRLMIDQMKTAPIRQDVAR
jgi:GTP-binding protein HflX